LIVQGALQVRDFVPRARSALTAVQMFRALVCTLLRPASRTEAALHPLAAISSERFMPASPK